MEPALFLRNVLEACRKYEYRGCIISSKDISGNMHRKTIRLYSYNQNEDDMDVREVSIKLYTNGNDEFVVTEFKDDTRNAHHELNQEAYRANPDLFLEFFDYGKYSLQKYMGDTATSFMNAIIGQPEEVQDSILAQLENALDTLNTLKIEHRDLSDDNIVITHDKRLKIIDFEHAVKTCAGFTSNRLIDHVPDKFWNCNRRDEFKERMNNITHPKPSSFEPPRCVPLQKRAERKKRDAESSSGGLKKRLYF